MEPAHRLRLKACLHPLRLKILEAVSRVPGSSLSLARRLGDRQPRVHYHLRCLERSGLVRVAEERRKRGVVERLYAAVPEAFALAAPFLSGPSEASALPAFLAPLLEEAAAPDALLAAESRTLRLTPGQARQLQEDILRLLRQYQARESSQRGEGRGRGESGDCRLAWLLVRKT